ncbi:TetR family transcriptional regulator [Nocardioides sp. dk4132]|uniref:TetR/AcrR family transcriptional regulator n=1 Tax=unclassified Nocardioides TaxID=2615069 RepID=UPI001296E3F3|nr:MULTISPECIES: TetR/AcrR family transcriptional regulator [unclassified Nocardioides]MQW74985.1 TetR family transcriptional regulator [Nocardioides sp. dk4132]QGA07833.1 TetR family transcriptional regulator [Nocardioides sp. dk884]
MSSQVSNITRRGVNPRQSETVERLLAAGSEELRAVGAEALTIRTVAARAGVSPATAYTYLASKHHLFAELFWRYLVEDPADPWLPGETDVVARLRAVTRGLSERLAAAPELAAAVTPALLGTDPDVDRLRLRIGGEFVRRFRAALAPADAVPVDEAVLDTLTLSFSGALLQTGMGLLTYAELADRLDAVVAVIMKGHTR